MLLLSKRLRLLLLLRSDGNANGSSSSIGSCSCSDCSCSSIGCSSPSPRCSGSCCGSRRYKAKAYGPTSTTHDGSQWWSREYERLHATSSSSSLVLLAVHDKSLKLRLSVDENETESWLVVLVFVKSFSLNPFKRMSWTCKRKMLLSRRLPRPS